jgi:hypothetical protein
MAIMKKSMMYGVAAVVMALAIIGTILYTNKTWSPNLVYGQTNFLVMLTDPPNVPKGTTKLEVTYSNIQLHVVSNDGIANWVAAQESGKVDLLSLVNVKQTIAILNLPTGSTVDKLQFTISSAKATINNLVTPVTILTDQLVVSLRGTKLTSTVTGALIDLRPTLMKINASDSNGEKISYYVLVPSATAIIKSNVEESQKHIGSKSNLDDNENKELDEKHESSKNNVVITEATLSVNGKVTTLRVTLNNNGDESARINGLKVQGDFKTDPDTTIKVEEGDGAHEDEDSHDGIVFKISGDTLIPLLGGEDYEKFDRSEGEVKSGESLTVMFSGVIQVTPDDEAPPITISPIKGNIYSINPLNENSESFDIMAS